MVYKDRQNTKSPKKLVVSRRKHRAAASLCVRHARSRGRRRLYGIQGWAADSGEQLATLRIAYLLHAGILLRCKCASMKSR